MLRTLFHPKEYVGGIPVESPVPITRKDLTLYSVLKTGTDVQTTGFLVWNVLRGCYSVTLSGTASAIEFGMESRVLDPVVSQPNSTQWPIPYALSSRMLNIKPDLTETMSMARISSGLINVYSATTSTTLAAINGQLAATSITDLRNCGEFSVPDLEQAASSVKDCVSNVRPALGVSVVVGSDVSLDVRMVDYDRGYANGADGLMKSTGTLLPALSPGDLWMAPVYSPFVDNPITLTGMFSNLAPSWGLGKVIPQGLDITVDVVISPLTAVIGATAVMNPFVEIHLGTVNPMTGICDTSVITCGLTAYNVNTPAVVAITHSTGRVKIPFDKQIIAVCVAGVASNATIPNSSVSYSLRLHDAYSESGFGSYRVVRWDNVDTTQTLNIHGTFMVEGVPSGPIAPYVKGTGTPSVSASVGHVITALRNVFASPSLFTRKVFVSSMLNENYNDVASGRAEDLFAAGMYASGMYAGGFGDIGKAIGGTLGTIAGTGLSLIGNTLDDAIGGLFASGHGQLAAPKRKVATLKRARSEF